MGREHISPWRRTRRRHDAFRRRRKDPWSRYRKLADYIIVTNDGPPGGDRRLGVDVRLRVCAERGGGGDARHFKENRVRHIIRSGGTGGVPRWFWRRTACGRKWSPRSWVTRRSTRRSMS